MHLTGSSHEVKESDKSVEPLKRKSGAQGEKGE